MPTIEDLQLLISTPREELSVEYKTWLDLADQDHRAVLAKAAIGIANHGGGLIVIGFDDTPQGLQSVPQPGVVPAITQDAVNGAIRRFAEPVFHCELHLVTHPSSGVVHPIVGIPSDLKEPVMSKRERQGVIGLHRCYVRKPGPLTEEPQTQQEWRMLLNRCVRAGREDMLESIRSIVTGRIDVIAPPPNEVEQLRAFRNDGRQRLRALTENVPQDSPSRFPRGYYEMAFSIIGGDEAANLNELRRRLEVARQIRHTGWTPFLELNRDGLAPYPEGNLIEAWVGRPVDLDRRSDHADFWRASPEGKLYTIRGYAEDNVERWRPGTVMDVTLPIWRIGEGVSFAARLAATFPNASQIAMYVRFVGLNGRRLVSDRYLINDDRISRTDQVEMTSVVTVDQARDNLAEILQGLLAPLYERFNFFEVPRALVDEETAHLLRGRF
jgi:hypothetical protein